MLNESMARACEWARQANRLYVDFLVRVGVASQNAFRLAIQ